MCLLLTLERLQLAVEWMTCTRMGLQYLPGAVPAFTLHYSQPGGTYKRGKGRSHTEEERIACTHEITQTPCSQVVGPCAIPAFRAA